MSSNPPEPLPSPHAPPSHPRSAHLLEPEPPTSRKRKRGHHAPEKLSTEAILIHPHPSSPSSSSSSSSCSSSVSLAPIRTISRARLQLSFLDAGIPPSPSNLPVRDLFSAHLPVLERDPSVVLIARVPTEKSKPYYAIERVRQGVYALRKLAEWVTTRDLTESACASGGAVPSLPRVVSVEDPSAWWSDAVLRKDDLLESILPKKPKVHVLDMSPPRPNPDVATPIPPNDAPIVDEASIPIVDADPQPIATEEVLGDLVVEYLKILYTSRTSLAYFAKGPLSRARNHFHGSETNPRRISELAAHLRAMVLSSSQMDTKYRERIPETVRPLPLVHISDDESPQKRKPRKPGMRKLKLKREGLYGVEEEYIKQWWRNADLTDSLAQDETLEQMIRQLTASLRIRETLAQLVIILEILAIEHSPQYKSEAAEPETHNDEEGTGKPVKAKRKKTPKNLEVMLDLLVDKLCIWQSVDEGMAAITPDAKKATTDPPESRDRLRSFCIEVIVPFYMSRIPLRASSISKKLGGPSAPSPIRPNPSKLAGSSKADASKGAPSDKKSSRRPLQRIATELNASATPRQHPKLVRSSTDSLVPVKREDSEPPATLSAIPLAGAPAGPRSRRTASRGSLSQFAKFKHREVDLVALGAATAAKAARKKHVERQLRDAIGQIRKPDRAKAGQEYLDGVEQLRATTIKARPKPGGPRRISDPHDPHPPSEPRIQVSVTPRRAQHHVDVVVARAGDVPDPTSPTAHRRPASAGAVAATPSVVPSSGPRPGHGDAPSCEVAETPSRGGGRFVSFVGLLGRADGGVVGTPMTMGGGGAVFATPVKMPALSPVRGGGGLLFTTKEGGAERTPRMRRKVDSGIGMSEDEEIGGKSLYERLGWDDEVGLI